MAMFQLPEGAPRIVQGRGEYACQARPCLLGRPIAAGEVHVSAHDNAPKTNSSGRAQTHLRHNHFSVRYHCHCFTKSATADTRTSMVRYDLNDLPGYERYGREVERLLREAR
ncbi:hypothetical protein L6R50_19925 [Myxococcota bacterium]|nr:hypothetical protein [Myxococcota bacterium]